MQVCVQEKKNSEKKVFWGVLVSFYLWIEPEEKKSQLLILPDIT